MENVSKALGAAPYAPFPPDGGRRSVKPPGFAADANLLFKKAPSSNLLLVGGRTGVSKILETILPNLRDPVTVWFPGSQLVLPPIAQTGTLILREVGALELGDQYRLNEWIERVQGRTWRTQIVSISAGSLLPRVHAGAFLDTLYYRLNTVYIDIST
jgi:hypothetical protein